MENIHPGGSSKEFFKNSKHRALSLDLLRVFAAFWVMTCHWSSQGFYYGLLKHPYANKFWPKEWENFLQSGFLGVDLFFIISGAVISGSAIQNRSTKFCESRILRIWPLYFLVTAISIVVVPFFVNGQQDRINYLPSLLMLQWWTGHPTIVGPSWTLFNEIRFYAAIAILIFFAKPNRESLLRFAHVWLCLLLLSPSLHIPALDFLIISDYGPHFVLGIYIWNFKSLKQIVRNGIPILVALSLVLLRVQKSIWSNPAITQKFWILIFFFTLIFLMWLLLIFEFRPPTQVEKLILTLSRMTYPFYLIHETLGMIFISILYSYSQNILISLSGGLLFVVFFALILSECVDRFIRIIYFRLKTLLSD